MGYFRDTCFFVEFRLNILLLIFYAYCKNEYYLQQPPPARSSIHASPLSGSPLNNRAANLSVPQPPQRTPLGRPSSGFPPGVKDLSPSVTITPAPPQPSKVCF